MKDKEKIEILRSVLLLVLDQVDFTAGSCSITDFGAALPTVVIDKARQVLKETKS